MGSKSGSRAMDINEKRLQNSDTNQSVHKRSLILEVDATLMH
jgi:hypothetical protein